MSNSTVWIDSDDETKLFVRRWTPRSSPKAVVYIVHGMAEHSERYERAALRLSEAGYEVWAADARGHG
jgi:alpha-beta hydrolase superfamily lysophospholipase